MIFTDVSGVDDKGIIEHGGWAVKPLAHAAMFRYNGATRSSIAIRMASALASSPLVSAVSIAWNSFSREQADQLIMMGKVGKGKGQSSTQAASR
jgi:hypothetical protein